MSASIFQFQILTGPRVLEDGDCPLKDLIHAGGSLHLSLALSSLCTRGRELAHFATVLGFFLISLSVSLYHPSITGSLYILKSQVHFPQRTKPLFCNLAASMQPWGQM